MFVDKSIWSRGRKIALAIVIILTVGAFGINAGADENWKGSTSLSQVRDIIDKLSGRNTELYDMSQKANQDLANEQSTVTDLKTQVSNLKQQLDAKQTELKNTVDTMTADKKKAIDEKNQEINQKIAEGNQMVADKQKEVNDKQKEVNDKQKEVDAKQKEVDAKQKEVDALNAKLQDAAANDEQLQKALADANKTKDYAQNALNNSK